jgi:hypothetical protein
MEDDMAGFRALNGWSLAGLALLGTLAATPAAMAQMASTPSALSEVAGATTGLGSSHRFATSAAAADHCPGDTVVWSTGPNLIYKTPGSAGYGQGKGFYACQAEADDAGFHPAS